jgi:hypothetical protein
MLNQFVILWKYASSGDQVVEGQGRQSESENHRFGDKGDL